MNRAADVVGGTVGLVLASPVLAAAAVAIKLEDGGPVFYRQRRVGYEGRDFDLLKLRTMVVGAERQGAGFAVNRGDPRITRTGRILRRLSLDELPQLWNVVRGDMSLIGPRPTLRYQVDEYTPRQRRRLDVKPGLTGWAQVNGRTKLPWDERIELDVWYVEHRSPWLDLKILLRTPLALVTGTYKGETGGWRPKDSAAARDIEDEYARKVRMFEHCWLIVLRGRMLRDVDPLYLAELVSHRVLRYGSGLLHLALLGASVRLAPRGRVYRAALGGQIAFLGAAAARPGLPRYYTLVTWATVVALANYLRRGVPAVWAKAEGTR